MKTENHPTEVTAEDLLIAENEKLKAQLKAATEPSDEEILIRKKMSVGLSRGTAIAAIRNQRVFTALLKKRESAKSAA